MPFYALKYSALREKSSLRSYNFNLRLITICVALILKLTTQDAWAQTSKVEWDGIEKSIASKKSLEETMSKLVAIKQQATKNGNDVDLARSYNHIMLIKDLKTEDSLYFKNSGFIDSLLTSKKSSSLLKTIMSILQAKRLFAFETKGYSFKAKKFSEEGLINTYGKADRSFNDSLIYSFLDHARISNPAIPKGSDVTWLSSNQGFLLFTPQISDVANAELIYIGTLHMSNKINVANEYKNWIRNLKGREEVADYLKIWVKSLQVNMVQENPDSLISYETFLKKGLASEHTLVKATAAHVLLNLYYILGTRYGKAIPEDDFRYYVSTIEDRFFYLGDSAYKDHFRKAVDIGTKFKDALVTYEEYANKASIILKDIAAIEYGLELEDVQIPNQPILAVVRFRNVTKLFYTLSKNIGDRKSVKVKESFFELPNLENDNNLHASYVKFDGLPAGKYTLEFSSNTITTKIPDSLRRKLVFDVTQISVLEAMEKLIILDRRSGYPIPGATAIGYKTVYDSDKKTKPGIIMTQSNEKGFVTFPLSVDSAYIIVNRDSLLYRLRDKPSFTVPDVCDYCDKEELQEFYEDNVELAVYTDRGIYRPGQTLRYKCILLAKDPKTGKLVPFNSSTNKYFKSWFKETNPKLFFSDPNYREIDSVALKFDDFGSFSGSFVIPKDAFTGKWSIESDELDMTTNYVNFNVEEYKRSSFEINLVKPKQFKLPGEPFQLKLSANALSGGSLGKMKVDYTVVRRGSVPRQTKSDYDSFPNTEILLLDTVVSIKEDGVLTIDVTDSLLKAYEKYPDQEWRYEYQVKLKVTDGVGESVVLNDSYRLTSRPVIIEAKSNRVNITNLPIQIRVSASDLPNMGSDKINGALFKIDGQEDTKGEEAVDSWLYTPTQLSEWFPSHNFVRRTSNIGRRVFVSNHSIDIKTGGLVSFAKNELPAGEYVLVLTSTIDGKRTGENEYSFHVFDAEKSLAAKDKEMSFLPYNLVEKGDSLTYYLNLNRKVNLVLSTSYYLKEPKGTDLKTIHQMKTVDSGLNVFRFKVPKNAIGTMTIRSAYVLNNKLSTTYDKVFITELKRETPEIIVKRYKKILTPGSKETFSIMLQNAKKKGQLLTTMYDASLDKLAEHYWGLPDEESNSEWTFGGGWSREISRGINESLVAQSSLTKVSRLLQGKIAGLKIIDKDDRSLNNYIYSSEFGFDSGVRRKSSLFETYIPVSRIASEDFTGLLVIIDDTIYTAPISTFDMKRAVDVVKLLGADAVSLYGSKAMKGVLIISTKGKITLPSVEVPKVIVRNNFDETAFFFPDIRANIRGVYNINFTMPQTATKWIWKMLMQTKDGSFVKYEQDLRSRLLLMVQPNIPRFLYQGDRISLKTRVSNLDVKGITVKLNYKIEDALTGEDLTKSLIDSYSGKELEIEEKQTLNSEIDIVIPERQLNALRVIVTAIGSGYSDAEEHLIPVQAKEIFASSYQYVTLNKSDQLVEPPALPIDAVPYGIGLKVEANPIAAMMNSLPFLANYPFDCSEQTFNKLKANLIGYNLAKAHPDFAVELKQNAEKDYINSNSPDLLNGNALPWLALDKKAQLQRMEMNHLLDTVISLSKIKEYLEKLRVMQAWDGGLPWFEDGASNEYISAYVLAGFSQIKNELHYLKKEKENQVFVSRLIEYIEHSSSNLANPEILYSIYSRLLWQTEYPLPPSYGTFAEAQLRSKLTSLDGENLYNQALWCVVAFQSSKVGSLMLIKAKEQVENILQGAIQDKEHGLRWKDISDPNGLGASGEQTLAMLAEAFRLAGKEKIINNDLVKWLLVAKKEDSWATTIGTAAAIELIEKSGNNLDFSVDTVFANLHGEEIHVDNDMSSVNSYVFKPIKGFSPIKISASGKDHVKAGITWYYFSSGKELVDKKSAVSLKKTIYYYDPLLKKWDELTPNVKLAVGDDVKIVLDVTTPTTLKFVQIEDKRAAAFEPADAVSGFNYEGSFSYYRSVRDLGDQFFAEHLPAGTTSITYKVRVSQEGTFRSNAAVLQCVYNPSIRAYSNIATIEIRK